MYITVSLAYSYQCTPASSCPPICPYKATDTSVGACVGLYTCVCVCLAVSICVLLCVHMSVCVCGHAPGSMCLRVSWCAHTCGCASVMHIPAHGSPGTAQSLQCHGWVLSPCAQGCPHGVCTTGGVQDEVRGSSPRSHAVHPCCHSHRSVSSRLGKTIKCLLRENQCQMNITNGSCCLDGYFPPSKAPGIQGL